jgi:hypothetical protein
MHYILLSLCSLFLVGLLILLLAVGTLALNEVFNNRFQHFATFANDRLVPLSLFVMLVSLVCFAIAGLVVLIGGGINAL